MTKNDKDEKTCCINFKKETKSENPTNVGSLPEPEVCHNTDTTNQSSDSDGNKNDIFGPAFDRAKHWYLGVVGATLGHRELAERCERRARYLNVTRVILNAIVSSAIFTSIGETNSEEDNDKQYILQVGAGALSILVAVLTAVSSALDYEGRREAHSNAKRAFAKIKHQMEMLLFIKQTPLVISSENRENEEEMLQWQEEPQILLDMAPEWRDIVKAWEEVDADSPDVPGELKKKLRNTQTSILNSLDLLNPKTFAPMVVKRKKRYYSDEEDDDEGEEF